MDYSAGKLGREAVADLEQVPDKDLGAWRPVFHPLYLFLRRNQKFLQFKRPYDYLTDRDLEKISTNGTVFRPRLDEAFTAFHASGKRLRVILGHRLLIDRAVPVQSRADRAALITGSRLPEAGLPPPPFQVSEDVLRVIGPLWGRRLEISPTLLSVLVESLCDPLLPESLERSHDDDVDRYVKALQASSWCVFLAMHLGMCDLGFLGRLRQASFEEASQIGAGAPVFRSSEENEIFVHARRLTEEVGADGAVSMGVVSSGAERISRKLEHRLKFVADGLAAQSELTGGAWHG